jgi:hypothetical protein
MGHNDNKNTELDLTNDPEFWEWLNNKDKVAEIQEQPRLELPLYNPSSSNAPASKEKDDVERGVCIIQM